MRHYSHYSFTTLVLLLLHSVSYSSEASSTTTKIVKRSSEPIDLSMDPLDGAEISEEIDWKWGLLSISGNSTIVKLRKKDFLTYLKMNLASLIGSEFDLVRVTSISYTPGVLVNVSLDWSLQKRILKSLKSLASHNDTLLDLSGEHFNLTEYVPMDEILRPKALSPLEGSTNVGGAAAADPRQMQTLIYLIIGITIAFILTSTLIFSVCHCIKASSQNNQDSKLVSNQQELVANIAIDEAESRNSTFQRRRNSNFQRQSYLQQSPMTEETISLEEFDQQHRRSIPKLIYSREFSDGLMVIPSEEDSLLNHPDDVLGPLESYDEYGAYVPHQFVLRKEPQYPNRRSHMNFPNGRHEDYTQHRSRSHRHRRRPYSEVMASPMSEILPPRPNSVLNLPPLSPPPDFHSGYCSDVPTNHHRSQRPETPLVLSSFRPKQPTPDEIQRDVEIVFHNMGLSPN